MANSPQPKTSTPSSTQRVYLALRDAIISGDIPPGSRMKVEQIKEDLNFGASPVREALSLLTSDQLVERLDQRGFRAARTSKAQFHEILDLRNQLDVLALKDSIAKAGADWEEDLVLTHHRMTQAAKFGSDDFEVHHKRFHMALLQGCGSPILMRFCEQLYDLNVRYRFLALRTRTYKKRDIGTEHQGILDAAVARDAELASARLVAHYSVTGDYLAEQFDT